MGAGEAGARRAPNSTSPIACIGSPTSRSRAASAAVVATRLGRGGQPGLPRPKGVRKFVVEFLGGPLATLPYGVKPEMVVTASRGSLQGYRMIEAVPDDVPGHWRADSTSPSTAPDPVEMRCFLQPADRR